MKSPRRLAWLALALGLTAGSLQAQEPSVFDKSVLPTGFSPFRRSKDYCPTPMPGAPMTPDKDPGKIDPGIPPAMAQEPTAQAAESFFIAPTMFGDSRSGFLIVGSGSASTSVAGLAPYMAKIADNASPAPLDRVYAGYNFYNNLGATGTSNINGHIETIGFEKTLLDGNASFGMRLPFTQLVARGFNSSTVGDLTLSGKYALINDRQTGNTLSTGLSITVPTGPSVTLPSGASINPVFLQPFVGVLYNSGDAFVHGFSSILVPTDSRDVTAWFNDVAVGYWIYKDGTNRGLITGVAPTFEVHVTTPLSHRISGTASDPNAVGFVDIVNLTMGGTVFMGERATLGAAYVLPVTGPKPFTGEAIIQFNLRF
jgi:hypothetical protein